MRIRRWICLLLLLALLTGTAAAAGTGQVPYAIRVNRAMNTVTIYARDRAGEYELPVKAMICSTARKGYVTPLGTFTLKEHRSPWRLMLDGTYGQYATCFKGNYLFHSVCYSDDSHDAMVRESYNDLGEAASMGCIRLETADAKWIYDHCPAGTQVTIYDDPEEPGPLGKPAPTVEEIPEEGYCGWDPTDPAPGNPWRDAEITKLELSDKQLKLAAGDIAKLAATAEPATAAVLWSSSDPEVARVDSQGTITALKAGTVEITARGMKGVSAACKVQVVGELLPFTDLQPGAWYYGEVRRALEQGLFQGTSASEFSPQGAMTRAMVVQVLYNLEGKPDAPEGDPFTDVAEEAWYRDAVVWAAEEGIVTGTSETRFAPNRAMTRQELAAVLWRYAGSPEAAGDLSAFTDGDQAADYAQTALIWMTEQGLMQGTDNCLQPRATATRIETAVILQRYTEQ